MDKPSVIDRLRWFDEHRHHSAAVDIVRQYRQLAEHLVDEADVVGPELTRALDRLLASMDDAVRVVMLATERQEHRIVTALLDEKKTVDPLILGAWPSSRSKS